MNNIEPYDPSCETYAKDMEFLDVFIIEFPRESATPEERAAYIESNEGTYNHENGHFLCDACYIRAGMPTTERGWICP